MAKKLNDGRGSTSGLGSVDFTSPIPTKTDPGSRVGTDADWVRRDRDYKESLPVQAFS